MAESELLQKIFNTSLDNNEVNKIANSLSNGSPNSVIRGCLVLLLRVGFLLIQLGSVPISCPYKLILQNIMDIALSITCFAFLGYPLAYGEDYKSICGLNLFIHSENVDFNNVIHGISSCLISTAIITTLLAGRAHLICHTIVTIIHCSVIQPLLLHWAWTNDGWMAQFTFMSRHVSLIDHAGAIIIHYSAGFVGFIGSIFLGRRCIRLDQIHNCSIGNESPGSTFSGYLFIIVGLMAFGLPNQLFENTRLPFNYSTLTLCNNLLATAGGILIITLLQIIIYKAEFNYWRVLRCLQGAIIGVVSISAGVHTYSPLFCFVIAICTSLLCALLLFLIFGTAIEDYCNITSIHLLAGFISILLPPLLGKTQQNFGKNISMNTRLIHVTWQIICIAAVTAFLLTPYIIIFSLLSFCNIIRNSEDVINHKRCLRMYDTGIHGFFQRIFDSSFETPIYEPGFSRSNSLINTGSQEKKLKTKNLRKNSPLHT